MGVRFRPIYSGCVGSYDDDGEVSRGQDRDKERPRGRKRTGGGGLCRADLGVEAAALQRDGVGGAVGVVFEESGGPVAALLHGDLMDALGGVVIGAVRDRKETDQKIRNISWSYH